LPTSFARPINPATLAAILKGSAMVDAVQWCWTAGGDESGDDVCLAIRITPHSGTAQL
jgi:hypothetical protein